MSETDLGTPESLSSIEILNGVPKSWESLVRDRYQGICGNCGGDGHLAVKMIVAEESGGQKIPSNGVLLCRACDLASEALLKTDIHNSRRLVNFWISHELYNWMQTKTGFESMGALIRYLMLKYIENELRFEDLEQYQDEGSDVKVNIWVDHDKYRSFKELLNARGMTVTKAFKSLLRMYQAELAITVSD